MRNYGQVTTNKYGTNTKIEAHILQKKEMRKLGFHENYYEGTDHEKYAPYWFRSVKLKTPNEFFASIDFDVRIYKDTGDVEIDVLDDMFCQPYQYQSMLTGNKPPRLAIIVDDLVEEQMEILQNAGILSGHVRGEYI